MDDLAPVPLFVLPPVRLYIVDDDDDARQSLAFLLEAEGFEVETLASAESFLAVYDPDYPTCLILDVRMAGLDGFGLQAILNEQKAPVSILFLSGHGTIHSAMRARDLGAVYFLEKPVDHDLLLKAIHRGIETAQKRFELKYYQERFERLSTREEEVLKWMIQGATNKKMASELDVSTRTIEVHRAHIFEKLQVKSVVEIVRLHDAFTLYLDANDSLEK